MSEIGHFIPSSAPNVASLTVQREPNTSNEVHGPILISAIILGLMAVTMLAIGGGCYGCIRRKKRMEAALPLSGEVYRPSNTPDSDASSRDHILSAMHVNTVHTGAQVFTYRQLRFATNNFSSTNLIGHGGFGSVYKGILPDGRVAAIKQLDRHGKQGEHEFRVEVDILSRLHSPYLLELIGYCADLDQRLLVYAYMPNGSLQDHLYSDGSAGNPPVLGWGRRLRIALDAARSLEYLHEIVTPPVIHRDFKTSNILLDENFKAKVSDFGLARLGSDKINGHVSTRVLGTQGYVAPEYVLTGHLTTKSDVYSYGVVLLELITGRVPVDMKRPPGQGILVSWALPRLTDRDKVFEMVDPALQGQFSSKELIQVAAIAAMCVQPEADYRPFMTDVVQSLIPLVRQRSRSENHHHF
ncbi:hypothetical protein SUGI_1083480 [Cryptomeria japonica]|nr:hypothetical protein SUGI_1083480 [Cryptomeria japonica]